MNILCLTIIMGVSLYLAYNWLLRKKDVLDLVSLITAGVNDLKKTVLFVGGMES